MGEAHTGKVNFIWSIAELLRGDYKRYEYGKVVLPFVVLRRLDCVLADTKQKVLDADASLPARLENREPALMAAAGQSFYNLSPLDLPRLLDDPEHIKENLEAYIRGFSTAAQDVLEKFAFLTQIDRLAAADLLFMVVSKFAELDLHPDRVTNLEMGYVFEELIRRFSEQSNETAGEHFTPREVIQLMVNVLFTEDEELLTTPGRIVTMLDPAAGTGGMLSVAEGHLRDLNNRAVLKAFGQELNEESYAICKADLMIKGQDPSNIRLGNSFTRDAFVGETFDYQLANPPFGVDWSKSQSPIVDEHRAKGFAGRFGPGLPRKSDGQLLFLLHMIAKMKPAEQGGSRIAIVFNGSPLFSGTAGSGESEIRRWIVENDWLEAVIALPDQLFYNTGISTYVWVVTNRKAAHRRGKVQLVDAREMFVKMRKSLGEKRKEISEEQIAEISRLYGEFREGERVKVLDNDTFGYRRITVEQPLRLAWRGGADAAEALRTEKAFASLAKGSRTELQRELLGAVAAVAPDPVTDLPEVERLLEQQLGEAWQGLKAPVRKALLSAMAVRCEEAPIVLNRKGKPEPDRLLRDIENVPVKEDVDEYLAREVWPFAPGAWADTSKEKVGYELPFTRLFNRATATVSSAELFAEAAALESRIRDLARLISQFAQEFSRRADAEEWPEVAVKRVARLTNGGTPRPEPANWGGPFAWATPIDVNRSDGFLTETQRTVTEAGLAGTSELLPEGSVLVTARAPIGSVSMTRVSTAFNQGCKGLSPRAGLVTPLCLAYQLMARKAELEARGQGSTFMEINAESLGSVKIVLPPISVQQELSFEAVISAYHESRRLYEQLVDLDRARRRDLDQLIADRANFADLES